MSRHLDRTLNMLTLLKESYARDGHMIQRWPFGNGRHNMLEYRSSWAEWENEMAVTS